MKTLENVVVLSLEDYEQLMKNQKVELKLGKWYWLNYVNNPVALIYYSGKSDTFGIVDGDVWTNTYGDKRFWHNGTYKLKEATFDQVFENLADYAKSLGFEGDFSFNSSESDLFRCDNKVILKGGVWSEPKPKIDYSKLKTGSVVTLNLNTTKDLTCATYGFYDSTKSYTIVILKSTLQISKEGISNRKHKTFCTLCDDEGEFIHLIDSIDNKVLEVISY